MKRETAVAVLTVATVALLVLIATLAPRAHAQPLSMDGVTYNSVCGEMASGVRGTLNGNLRIEMKAEPGQRVGGNGHWEPCTMPKDCPEQPSPYWIGKTGRVCESPKPIPARDVGRRVELSTGYGKLRGYATMICAKREDGSFAWVMEKYTCGLTPQSMLKPEDRKQPGR